MQVGGGGRCGRLGQDLWHLGRLACSEQPCVGALFTTGSSRARPCPAALNFASYDLLKRYVYDAGDK